MRTGIITAMLAIADAAHAAITPSSYSNSADLCGGKLVQDKGNQYCQKVQRIAYENMGKAGSYEQVVHMNQETGDCEFAPIAFSGPIAPFDNPLSLHFRGPLNLKQVAVYIPATRDNKVSEAKNKPATDTAGIKARTANGGHGQHRAPHLEHYYNAFPGSFNNGTRWIPPINDHRHHTHSSHAGLSVSIPTTGSSSRLDNWKLPPTPTTTPNSVTAGGIETIVSTTTAVRTVEIPQKLSSTATTANLGPVGFATVTVTVTSYVSGTSVAGGCNGKSSGSIGTSTPSMTTIVTSMSSPTSVVSSGSSGSDTAVSTTSMATTVSSCSTVTSIVSSASRTGVGTPGQASTTVSFGTIIPGSAVSSRRRCSKTMAPSPSSVSLTSSSSSGSSSDAISAPSATPASGTSYSTGSTSSTRSYSVVPIYGSSSVPAPIPSSNPGGGSTRFVRTGYYSAEQQKAEGVIFLGNYGGQGSGKWTPTFGNTLSFVNANGTGGAPNANILKDTTLGSLQEVSLFTNVSCNDDDSCGYVQNGSVAYKGFGGASKIFLLEFSMPHTTAPPAPGSNTTTPGYDQPAIWLLNARIPYTAQYHKCSCWPTGCGELDVFEVLSPSDNRATSSVHATYVGSDPNWFERPTDVDKPVRVAVVFDGERGAVEILVLGRGEGEFPEGVEGGFEGLGRLGDAGGGGNGPGSLYQF